MRNLTLALFALLALSDGARAQSNVIPGNDVALSNMGTMFYWGRQGTYPNGVSGFSMSTTVCNTGVNSITWNAPMNAVHPFIAFLVVKNTNGRMVQVSDRSYVKHGYFSVNSSGGGCGSCPGNPPSNTLGVACSDTYSSSNNANHYYLGPPDEIDPWLGVWGAQCSHFDRGEPAVSPPQDCDSNRSLTMSQANALAPVGHRVRLLDADLSDTGATFYHQAAYLIRGMDEGLRGDDLGWRSFRPIWNAPGNSWSIAPGAPMTSGSVLSAWSGATVASAANAGMDGRVYVGSLGTQGASSWHYELALHNRDNHDGIEAIRIPLTPGAVVTGAGFLDLDSSSANDWTAAVVGNELVFTGPGNPLTWNTIYNVWFDTDASPATGAVTLGQVHLADFQVAGLFLPVGVLQSSAVSYCTAGTSANGCSALVSTTGVPSATAPSGHFLVVTGLEGQKDGQFFYGANGRQANPWGNGTSLQCVAPPTRRGGLQSGSGTPAACDGTASQDLNARWTAKPGHNPGPGATVQAQYWYRDPQNTSNQTTSLSDALEFVVGP